MFWTIPRDAYFNEIYIFDYRRRIGSIDTNIQKQMHTPSPGLREWKQQNDLNCDQVILRVRWWGRRLLEGSFIAACCQRCGPFAQIRSS